MKRNFKLIVLALLLALTTGCVKANITMDIKKDKSMSFTIIEAFDKSLAEGDGEMTVDEDEFKEYENNGFYIQDYSEDDMIGYKISKDFANIDEVSTEGEVIYELDLEKMSDSSNYMFSVKKGFFKNVYTAKMTFASLSDLSGEDTESTEEDNLYNDESYFESEDDIYTDESTTGSENLFGEDFDYSSMASGIDFKFYVNLPYKAISNNATTVENNSKSLTWDLLKATDAQTIDFEFALYNMTNIYIVGGIALVIIILIIVAIINSTKKGNPTVNNNNVQSQFYERPQQTNNTFFNNNQSNMSNDYNSNIQTTSASAESFNNSFIQPMNNEFTQNNNIDNFNVNQPEIIDNNIQSTNINNDFIQNNQSMPTNSFFQNIEEQPNNSNNQYVNPNNNYFAGYTNDNNNNDSNNM